MYDERILKRQIKFTSVNDKEFLSASPVSLKIDSNNRDFMEEHEHEEEEEEKDKSRGAIRRFPQLSVRIQLFPPFFKGRQMWVDGNKTNYQEVVDICFLLPPSPSPVALSSHKSSRNVEEVCENESTNGV